MNEWQMSMCLVLEYSLQCSSHSIEQSQARSALRHHRHTQLMSTFVYQDYKLLLGRGAVHSADGSLQSQASTMKDRDRIQTQTQRRAHPQRNRLVLQVLQ